MSEYVLEPFLRLNALLKELLSYSDKKKKRFRFESTNKKKGSQSIALMSKNRGKLRTALKDIKEKPNILQNYIQLLQVMFWLLTQLFFFFFLASWSFMLPILDILVRLLRLEMLSHEFWR